MNDRIRKKQLRRAKEMLPPTPIVLNIDAKALAKIVAAAMASHPPAPNIRRKTHESIQRSKQ